MKLLVDMNLSPRWTPFLLDAGHKAVHWSIVGKADATDSEIMAFAAANDYVVLTNDLDRFYWSDQIHGPRVCEFYL